ncbi:anti-sigma factor family protein [Sphingobium nicotianae]|uniref:Anti-sigma factor n=1 Tax=Sphingobium nicotianae TaxID=2782607 RepID=A0A9X1DEA9_9SPHN|nr:anti-sigma factor [Sphingobium nicotianae]MBT2188612.1 anti-sigma factor [Sphingobium nicotianae]
MNGGRPITDDDLQGYIDDAIDSRRRAEVEAYLADHPQVAERIALDRALRGAMRDALGPIADEPVPAELNLSRLIDRHQRQRRNWRSGPWQVAAALLLMVMGGVGGWGLRSAQEPPRAGIAALAQEATDSYAVYAPDMGRPVEIKAADAPQLIQWASRRLERPVSIPDLSGAGYSFIGGRVVPTPHGPAVLYMFDNGKGTRLTMLSRNMAIDRDTPMKLGNAGRVTSVSWSRDGLGFSLVGPLGEAELHPIADVARAQFNQAI